MPGTPPPVGQGPSGLPPFIWALLQNQAQTTQTTQQLSGGATAGVIPDQWGNATEVYGTNLNQVVTIGAAYSQAGVQVATGIANGTSGRAIQSGPATTTITLTQGSTSATVGSVSGASLAKGQVIGAALVVSVSAITPGTTIASVSGSSVTLSQAAAASGTGLYCAAARFVLQQDTGWVALSLASGWSALAGYYTPSVRLINDRVYFSGGFASGGSTPPAVFTTLPSTFRPASTVTLIIETADGASFGTVTIATGGTCTLSFTPTNTNFGIDSLSYRLS